MEVRSSDFQNFWSTEVLGIQKPLENLKGPEASTQERRQRGDRNNNVHNARAKTMQRSAFDGGGCPPPSCYTFHHPLSLATEGLTMDGGRGGPGPRGSSGPPRRGR